MQLTGVFITRGNVFLECQGDKLNALTGNNQAVNDIFLKFDKALANNPFMEIGASAANEIGNCMVFAAEKHQGQKRKDAAQTPYIVHPIGVALILLKEVEIGSPEVLKIALLHDTIEDTNTTHEEIAKKFGANVADPVQELSDEVGNTPGVKTQDQATRKRLEVEHAGKLSFEATVVKLADKLYNMRDLIDHAPKDWPKERFLGYSKFVEEILKNIVAHNEEKKGAQFYPGLLKLEKLVQEQIEVVRKHFGNI